MPVFPAAGSVAQATAFSTVTVLAERVEVIQVLQQQLLGALELVPQRAADLQVVGERLAQRAHDAPPGHGSASSLRRSRSTLA